MKWNKIISKKVLIVLFSFIVSIVVSCLYTINVASSEESWGLYRLLVEQSSLYDPYSLFAPLYILILIVIGFIFGIFLIYILKVTKLGKIIKINLFTSVLAVIFYILITLLINWSYFTTIERQHYAGSGLEGCIGDFVFIAIAIFISYGIFLIIGFLIGGITLYLSKRFKGRKQHV